MFHYIFSKSNRWAVALTIASAFTAAATVAQAGTVDVKYLGYKGGTIYTNLGNGGAGAFQWEKVSGSGLPFPDGNQFISFCIDIFEHIKTTGVTSYNVVDPAAAPNNYAMVADKAGLLSHWFGKYYQGNTLDQWTKNEARAFQMGVWEIVFDDLNLIGDVFAGSFFVNGPNTARALAQNWFDDLTWKTGKTLDLVAMSTPSGPAVGRYQDQIVVVPVPAAVYPGLILLTGLAASRKLRQRQSA